MQKEEVILEESHTITIKKFRTKENPNDHLHNWHMLYIFFHSLLLLLFIMY